MPYNHGVYNQEQETSLTTPIQGTAGLQVIFGTAPIHMAADLAASYTRHVVEALTLKAERALEQTGLRTLVLAGGVAANSHLRASLEAMCRRRGCRLSMPELPLCGDNGAMIAAAGYFQAVRGNFADSSLNASAGETLPAGTG